MQSQMITRLGDLVFCATAFILITMVLRLLIASDSLWWIVRCHLKIWCDQTFSSFELSWILLCRLTHFGVFDTLKSFLMVFGCKLGRTSHQHLYIYIWSAWCIPTRTQVLGQPLRKWRQNDLLLLEDQDKYFRWDVSVLWRSFDISWRVCHNMKMKASSKEIGSMKTLGFELQ